MVEPRGSSGWATHHRSIFISCYNSLELLSALEMSGACSASVYLEVSDGGMPQGISQTWIHTWPVGEDSRK